MFKSLFNVSLILMLLVKSSFAEMQMHHAEGQVGFTHPESNNNSNISLLIKVLPDDLEAVDYDGRDLEDIRKKHAVELMSQSPCAESVAKRVAAIFTDIHKVNLHVENAKKNVIGCGPIKDIRVTLEFNKQANIKTCPNLDAYLVVEAKSRFEKELVFASIRMPIANSKIDYEDLAKQSLLSACAKLRENKQSILEQMEEKTSAESQKNILNRYPVLKNFFH